MSLFQPTSIFMMKNTVFLITQEADILQGSLEGTSLSFFKYDIQMYSNWTNAISILLNDT